MAAVLKAKFGSLALHSSSLLSISRPVLFGASRQMSNGGEGWFSKLLMVRKIEPGKDSHSRLLSDAEIVYELQIHDVKPGCMDQYLKGYDAWTNQLQSLAPAAQLVASWKVEIGDQDQVCHIWKYTQGYNSAGAALKLCREDSLLQKLDTERLSILRSRQNQFMLAFSFWGHPEPKDDQRMFEMRSYVLKPGTMIEWGNNCARLVSVRGESFSAEQLPNWFNSISRARGINYRKGHAVAGFFSQIGQLYMVHHIWGYKDLQIRKDVRENAWRKPGWDECVAYTVPLIREMRSRWMSPNPFSPIK